MSDNSIEQEKKQMEIIEGNGKNLDISPVYDHLIVDKPTTSERKKQIIIPKEKKNKKKKFQK